MAGNPLQDPQTTLAREEIAWQLRAQGWTQQRIADFLELHQTTVSDILKRVATKRLAELKEAVDAQRAEQHEQLNHVLDEALQAWDRLKTANPKTAATYLTQAQKALEGLRKLWGLDAPERVRLISEREGGTDPREMTREQLLAVLNQPTGGSEGTAAERNGH